MSGVLKSIKSAVLKPFGRELATRTETVTKTKTVDFIRLAEKDRPTPEKLIRLGGKIYKIRYTDEDKTRRTNYFINDTGSLTADEIKLLDDIGLDVEKDLSKNDKKIMPDFFNALPDCQTSAAISLSAKCFMPHHIISEIIEHASIANESAHKEFLAKKSPTSDEHLTTAALLKGAEDLIRGAFPMESGEETGPSMVDEDSMYDFFLLRI